MDAQLQAGVSRRRQDSPRIVGAEDVAFAEDIAPFGQSLRLHARDHLVDHERDVLVAPRAVLDGHLVRAQERRHQIHRVLGIEAPDRVKIFREELCAGADRAGEIGGNVAPDPRTVRDDGGSAPGRPASSAKRLPSPGRNRSPRPLPLRLTPTIPV